MQDISILKDFRYLSIIDLFCNNFMQQTNIVCGGKSSASDILDTCEQNISGERSWSYTGALPQPLYGIKGVTIDNRVLFLGR